MAWYNTKDGDASTLTTGELPDARLSANVTTEGNTFNGANQLVQLDGTSRLPAVDGSQLTGLPTGTLGVLSTTLGVDLNSTAKQTLYTVPGGKSAIVTRVVVYNNQGGVPSTSNVDFGFNATADDVINNSKINNVDAADKFAAIDPDIGGKVGAAAGVFGVKVATGMGAGRTVDIKVVGMEF